jgi:hypothetical protein
MLKQAHSASIERITALQGEPAPAPSRAKPEDHADPYALPPASQAAPESRAAASSAASAAAEEEEKEKKKAPFELRSVKVAAATAPSPFLTPPPAASLGTPPQSERVLGAQRASGSGSGSEPAGSGSAPASSTPPSPSASRAPSLSAAEAFAAPAAAAADGAAPRLKIVYSASSLCSSPSLRAGSSLALEVPGHAPRRHTALVLYLASDDEEAEAGDGGDGDGAAGAAAPVRPAVSAAGAAAGVLQRRLSGVYGAHHVQLQKLKAQMGDVAGARLLLISSKLFLL